jgi:outer membrane protein insertion porin family
VRRHFLQLLAVVLTLVAVPRVHAQQQGQTAPKVSKIAEITVAGTRKFPTEQIVSASGLKPGDVVSAEQIQGAADRLAALGVFSTVNYRFSSKGDTIVLEFQVQEAPTVPLSFDNFPWFTDGELVEAIRQEAGLFTGEAPESGTMLDEITVAVEKLLSSRKIRGTITHQLTAQPVGDGMIMQFRVEGPVIKIQSLQFGDPLAADSERLKDRLSDLEGQPYSRFAIEVFENEQVRPLYASKGYLRAQIGPPQPRLAGNPDDSGGSSVEVLIPISPGQAYLWNGASWQGNIALSSASLDGVAGMKSGDVADGIRIEAAWKNVESEYGNHGYLDVKLTQQPDFDDAAHRVSYHVSIAEGPQYRMGEMIITGLSLDAEQRLQHAWQLAPGQVFDNGYFERLLKVLAKPSPDIFGNVPVHYTECGHWLRSNADRHTVDVLLDFK